MIEILESFRDMAARGNLPVCHFEKIRRIVDELCEINHAAKVRKYRTNKLQKQVEHYGRGVAARRGLKGLKIKVEIEGAE